MIEPQPVLTTFTGMSTVQEIESAISRLSPEEMRAVRDWLENLLEDRMELKDEFKTEIEVGMKDITEGRYRIHRP